MSLSKGFPFTFNGTNQTNQCLKAHDNELSKLYTDINYSMAANGHSHTGNGSDGAPISYNNLLNKPESLPANGGNADTATTATKFATARNINGVPFDGTADIMLETNTPGLTNYVADGLKLTPSAGLTATVSAGRASISETVASLAAPIDITLDARRACLVYFSKNGNIGKVNASLPAVDTNTVALWDFSNWDGVSPIPNSAVGVNGNTIAVANNLTKSGTVTRVDGHVGYAAQGDGSTGYFVSANSTGFPIGASGKELTCVFTCLKISGEQMYVAYGTSPSTGTLFSIYSSGSMMKIAGWGSDFASGYGLEIGKTYIITIQNLNNMSYIYINGILVAFNAHTLNIGLAVLYLNRAPHTNTGYNAQCITHFVELRNNLRTPAQISEIANKLLLPNRYYPDTSKPEFTDVRSILPANSISLGITKTSSTAVTSYNDTDYQFGRREGATGGNRKVFLGWQNFSGSAIRTWENPFGTSKVSARYVCAQDANGTNEFPTLSWFYNASGTPYGVVICPTKANILRILTHGNGVALNFDDSWQTSGYLGCYAEVLE